MARSRLTVALLVLLASIALLGGVAQQASALSFFLESGESFELIETIPTTEVGTFNFFLAGGGTNVLDVVVLDGVNNQRLHEIIERPSGAFTLHAVPDPKGAQQRRYKFIFTNPRAQYKVEVHYQLSRLGQDVPSASNGPELDPVEKEVNQLYEVVKHFAQQQPMLRQQQRAHRDTVEVASERVLYWSVFQVIVLIGMSAVQLFLLKRFLERKSTV